MLDLTIDILITVLFKSPVLSHVPKMYTYLAHVHALLSRIHYYTNYLKKREEKRE